GPFDGSSPVSLGQSSSSFNSLFLGVTQRHGGTCRYSEYLLDHGEPVCIPTEQWFHLVVTHTVRNMLMMYINGLLVVAKQIPFPFDETSHARTNISFLCSYVKKDGRSWHEHSLPALTDSILLFSCPLAHIHIQNIFQRGLGAFGVDEYGTVDRNGSNIDFDPGDTSSNGTDSEVSSLAFLNSQLILSFSSIFSSSRFLLNTLAEKKEEERSPSDGKVMHDVPATWSTIGYSSIASSPSKPSLEYILASTVSQNSSFNPEVLSSPLFSSAMFLHNGCVKVSRSHICEEMVCVGGIKILIPLVLCVVKSKDISESRHINLMELLQLFIVLLSGTQSSSAPSSSHQRHQKRSSDLYQEHKQGYPHEIPAQDDLFLDFSRNIDEYLASLLSLSSSFFTIPMCDSMWKLCNLAAQHENEQMCVEIMRTMLSLSFLSKCDLDVIKHVTFLFEDMLEQEISMAVDSAVTDYFGPQTLRKTSMLRCFCSGCSISMIVHTLNALTQCIVFQPLMKGESMKRPEWKTRLESFKKTADRWLHMVYVLILFIFRPTTACKAYHISPCFITLIISLCVQLNDISGTILSKDNSFENVTARIVISQLSSSLLSLLFTLTHKKYISLEVWNKALRMNGLTGNNIRECITALGKKRSESRKQREKMIERERMAQVRKERAEKKKEKEEKEAELVVSKPVQPPTESLSTPQEGSDQHPSLTITSDHIESSLESVEGKNNSNVGNSMVNADDESYDRGALDQLEKEIDQKFHVQLISLSLDILVLEEKVRSSTPCPSSFSAFSFIKKKDKSEDEIKLSCLSLVFRDCDELFAEIDFDEYVLNIMMKISEGEEIDTEFTKYLDSSPFSGFLSVPKLQGVTFSPSLLLPFFSLLAHLSQPSTMGGTLVTRKRRIDFLLFMCMWVRDKWCDVAGGMSKECVEAFGPDIFSVACSFCITTILNVLSYITTRGEMTEDLRTEIVSTSSSLFEVCRCVCSVIGATICECAKGMKGEEMLCGILGIMEVWCDEKEEEYQRFVRHKPGAGRVMHPTITTSVYQLAMCLVTQHVIMSLNSYIRYTHTLSHSDFSPLCLIMCVLSESICTWMSGKECVQLCERVVGGSIISSAKIKPKVKTEEEILTERVKLEEKKKDNPVEPYVLSKAWKAFLFNLCSNECLSLMTHTLSLIHLLGWTFNTNIKSPNSSVKYASRLYNTCDAFVASPAGVDNRACDIIWNMRSVVRHCVVHLKDGEIERGRDVSSSSSSSKSAASQIKLEGVGGVCGICMRMCTMGILLGMDNEEKERRDRDKMR
ncbi:hypothetical protein ADUPG1_010759, partial [Aduncisulcus paluster]